MLAESASETKAEFDRLNARSFEYQVSEAGGRCRQGPLRGAGPQIKEAGINSGFQNSSIRLADPARPAENRSSPNMRLNLLVAFLFSTLLAVGAAVISDVLDKSIRDPEQIAVSSRPK